MGWKILIIEDDPVILHIFKNMVFSQDPRFVPIFASSIEEALELFSKHDDIDGISVDGCVPSDFPTSFGESNTTALVERFKKNFSGPIIAASSGFNRDLCNAGCTHQVNDKFDVGKKFLEIFSTSPPMALEASHGKTAL